MTESYLLEGMMYAAEQCGLLLEASVVLYKSGYYSTAVVLAAFAREELGRSDILTHLRKKVADGSENFTVDEIRAACDDHVQKQRSSQHGTTVRSAWDDRIGRLARLMGDPRDPEFKKASSELADIVARKRKRAPDDRHILRMKALYVEPDASGKDWNRPHQIDEPTAKDFLTDAANDYASTYDRLQNGYIREDDEGQEIFRFLQDWTQRPQLPLPAYPFD